MIFLSALSLIGYSLYLKNKSTLSFCFCPLWVNALLILILYSATFFGGLETTSLFIALGGICISPWAIFVFYKNRDKDEQKIFAFYCAMLIFIYFYVQNIPFSVSDDFVYWGAASKYLFIKKHFLDSLHTLYPKHETYTPGLALLHFFFLIFQKNFSIANIYFAQSSLLVSCLLVVLRSIKVDKINSFLFLSLVTSIFFGSIFAKLSVDYLLSLIGFSILWFAWHEKDIKKQLFFLPPVFLLLFLIKQAGLLIILFVLSAIAFFPSVSKKKYRPLLMAVTVFLLLILKSSWSYYIKSQGFSAFITLSFDDFVLTIKNGAWWLYLKTLIFGKADKLNLPFLFWGIIFFLASLFLLRFNKNKKSLKVFLLVTLIFFSLYLFILGVFEMHAFKSVIYEKHEFPALSRYINLFFCVPLFFILILSTEKIADIYPKLVVKGFIFLLMAFVVVFIIGRHKRLHEDFAQQDKFFLQKLEDKYQPLKNKQQKKLCYYANEKIKRYLVIYTLLPNYHIQEIAKNKKNNGLHTCQDWIEKQ